MLSIHYFGQFGNIFINLKVYQKINLVCSFIIILIEELIFFYILDIKMKEF